MNLQPSEFIAKTQAPDNNLIRASTHGTVVRLRNHIFVLVDASRGPHQWIHAKTGRGPDTQRHHRDPVGHQHGQGEQQ